MSPLRRISSSRANTGHSRIPLTPGAERTRLHQRPSPPSPGQVPYLAKRIPSALRRPRDQHIRRFAPAHGVEFAVIRITTICLSRINHLRLSLCPSIVHCGQGGIRFVHYPILASFRISRGAAATARFRGPGVPSRQSAHFGFVPSSAQGGQRRPAIAATPVALPLKNAAFRRHSCGFAQ
jgi:hypothetical protein